MPSNPKSLSERVQEIFSQSGDSWRNYVLITDTESPSIMRASPDGVAILHIDDPALAQACVQFLREHEAQTFRDFDELYRAFGIRDRSVQVKPLKQDEI